MPGVQVMPLGLTCGLTFFVRGLAVFVMGLAIVLSLPRGREIPLAWHLRPLGAFALIQCLTAWLGATQVWGLAEGPVIEYMRVCLRLIAAAFLLRFGCGVLAQRAQQRLSWLQWFPFLAVLCVGYLTVGLWEANASDWSNRARWLALGVLYLPGVTLAAIAFWGLHIEMKAVGLQMPDRDARLVAVAFAAEAAAVALIVFPASLPTTQQGITFSQRIAALGEMARPLAVLILAAGIVRFLRLFDLESQRRLESLEYERQEALKKTEEAQIRLMQEVARWRAQLEMRVRQSAERTPVDEQDDHWYESLQAIAVARERERISQELHDGIAQLLGYINLRTQAARRALLTGRTSEAALALQQVEWLTQAAHGEIREAILGLRLATPLDGDMVVTLSEYLEHFQGRWGVTAELIVEDADALALSPLVEIQVLRVIQEALTNVRKHAQARHVGITFKTEGNVVAVTIEDNGKGFDPKDVRLGHFGLRLMRERCESVGGSLHVESVIGRGTRLEARFPLNVPPDGKEKVQNEADQRIGCG